MERPLGSGAKEKRSGGSWAVAGRRPDVEDDSDPWGPPISDRKELEMGYWFG
jgi:hypothetical protein